MKTFEQKVCADNHLMSSDIHTIQVNVGLKCNLQCRHCHVESSPHRTEMMTWDTMEHIIQAARKCNAQLIDITGGAPELNPHLRKFVTALKDEGFNVLVRTNLTVFFTGRLRDMPAFFSKNKVKIVASLPCYLEENVTLQRGSGVFRNSVRAIRMLNAQGYGIEKDLPLTLVYNPIGAFLPPVQCELEAAYRSELRIRYDIRFTNLIAITNMAIGQFKRDLKSQGKLEEYTRVLYGAFNPQTIDGLMCRHQVNVAWDGTLYDCDFNFALGMPVEHGVPNNIRDFEPAKFAVRHIVTGEHCFGCTAGAGSSCGGSLVDEKSTAQK